MSSNTSSNTRQAAFLIEMSDQIRHIIMKRNYLLRCAKSRRLLYREQIAGKSWLEVAMAEKPKADVLPWDQAHNLAEKFKVELRADVFVEPAHEAGRHHQLTAQVDLAPHLGSDEHLQGSSAFDFDPMAAMGLSGGVRINRSAGGQFGMAGMGLPASSVSGIAGIAGMPNIPGMPNIGGTQNQDPTDFLPAHVREALSFGDSKKSGEIVLPALRELPLFGQLPEATRNMIEVEAVQVLQGMMAQVGPSEHSEQSLVALAELPGVSKRLKRFLSEALLLEAA